MVLSDHDNSRAVAWLEEGMSTTVVAKKLGVSSRGIGKLWDNFCVRGTVKRASGSGRPTMFSPGGRP